MPKANAEQLALLHGHDLLPWMDSPMQNVGSLTSCIGCGREIHVTPAGMHGSALDEDCPNQTRRV